MLLKRMASNVLYFLFIVYPFLPLIKDYSLVIGNVLEMFLIILLFVSAFLVTDNRNIVVKISKWILILLIIISIYFFINTLDLYDALSALRIFLLYIALGESIKTCMNSNAKSCKMIINISMWIVIIMGIGAVIQFIFPELIKNMHARDSLLALRYKTDWQAFSRFNRAISFMNDPNVLATYFCFNIFMVHQYFKGNRTKNKLYYFFYTVSILGCVLTQSRTGILLLGIYFFVNIIHSSIFSMNISRFKIILYIILVCGVLFWSITHISEILMYLRIDTLLSGNGRFESYNLNLKAILSQSTIPLLFGNGLTSGRSIIFENSYLLCFYMFGILGFCAIVFIIANIYRSDITKENIYFVLCFLIVCYVGDYVLIPQIAIYVIAGIKLSSLKIKKVIE